MLVVRSVKEQDLDRLLELISQVGDGMTTLKPDCAMLAKRVGIACASFAERIAPPQRDYLFVIEDSGNDRLVGVCAIKGAVGLDEPFYNYRIGTLVHSSTELQVFSRMDTLYLSNDLTGCAELCSLFLHPDYRSGHNGKLLSKSRFLFIAQFPHLFSEKLIAEIAVLGQPRPPFFQNGFQPRRRFEQPREKILHRRTDAAPSAIRRLPAARGPAGNRQSACRYRAGAPLAGAGGYVLRRLR
jgi:arginine/ornithine succinyltransferase subunit-like protein